MSGLQAKLRYYTRQLLARLSIKDTVRRLFQLTGLYHQVALTFEKQAARFYQNSCHRIADWQPVNNPKRVLFFAGRAHDLGFPTTEGLLGWALKARGAQPTFLICDGYLTACELSTINDFDSDDAFVSATKPARCGHCYAPSQAILTAYGWQTEAMSQFVTAEDWQTARQIAANLTLAEAFSLHHDGINIGEHIESSAYRTLFSTLFSDDDPVVVQTVRRLTENAVIIAIATQRAFKAFRPEVVVAHHGIYLTAGIPCEYAKMQHTPVVNWSRLYRRNTVTVCHNDTYHRALINEPVSYWEDYAMSESDRAMLADYLGSHWKGGWDLTSYNRDTDDSPQRLAHELNLDPHKPVIGMYTNLAWDARIHYAGNTFANHSDWLIETVGYFIDKPHVQIVIRVHPAEIKHGAGPVRQRADDLIRAHYPDLPQHIKIIPPESKLSSYGLMHLTAVNVVFGTKLGIEMAALGLKVIVAGEAPYRAKGFTYDPPSVEDYFSWLNAPDELPPLTPAQVERAKRYAYHFYFRRNISFPSLVYHPRAYLARSIDDLLPGRYANLDIICSGILSGTPFVAATPL